MCVVCACRRRVGPACPAVSPAATWGKPETADQRSAGASRPPLIRLNTRVADAHADSRSVRSPGRVTRSGGGELVDDALPHGLDEPEARESGAGGPLLRTPRPGQGRRSRSPRAVRGGGLQGRPRTSPARWPVEPGSVRRPSEPSRRVHEPLPRVRLRRSSRRRAAAPPAGECPEDRPARHLARRGRAVGTASEGACPRGRGDRASLSRSRWSRRARTTRGPGRGRCLSGAGRRRAQ